MELSGTGIDKMELTPCLVYTQTEMDKKHRLRYHKGEAQSLEII